MAVSSDGVLEAVFDPAWAAVRLVVDGGMWPLSATNLLTNPSFEATSGTVEVRRNLCVDPRLTSGTTSATRWYGAGGSGVTTWGNAGGPGGREFGRKAWSVVPTATADIGFQGGTSYKTDVTPGVAVFISAKARCNNAVATFSAGAVFYDSAGATIGSVVYSNASGDIVLSPAWQTVAGWVTPPANAVSMVYVISNHRTGLAGVTVGTTLDCADVVVASVASDFFDGTFSPDSDLTPSWTGAANASPSVLTGVGVTGVAGGTGRFGISSQQWAASGTRSLRIISTGASADAFPVVIYTFAAGDVGKTFTVLGQCRLSGPTSGNSHENSRAIFVSGQGSKSAQAVNVAGVTDLRLTFTVTAAGNQIRLGGGGTVGGGDVWWDKVALVEGVYTGPAFDGNTPAADGATYAWNGPINGSTSTATATPITAITITRTVPGTPTIGVRGINRLPVVGGFYIGSDTEMPLDSSVTYTVTGYSAAGAAVKTATTTVDTTGTTCGAWLKVAGHPNLTTNTVLRDVSEVESSTQGGVYDIAGGGGIAVAEVAGVNADRFTLTIGSLSTQQTDAIRAVIERHRIVLIQSCSHQPFDSGWYFIESAKRALRGQLATIPGRNFTLSLVGTGIPSGAGQGIAGWSWGSVMGTYPTWADLQAAHPSWFDLMQGV